MNTFKRILLAFMAIPAVLSGCSQFDSEVSLRELSFEIGSDIVWNAEYMAYTLRLSLKEGSDGDYLFSYSIDGDALIKLLSTGGGTVESGRELSLEGSKPAIYILPGLASDKDVDYSEEIFEIPDIPEERDINMNSSDEELQKIMGGEDVEKEEKDKKKK